MNLHAAHEKIRILSHQFKVALSLLEQENPSCYSLLQNDIKRHVDEHFLVRLDTC